MFTKERRGGWMNWEIGIDIYTLLWMKQRANENLKKNVMLKKKKKENQG